MVQVSCEIRGRQYVGQAVDLDGYIAAAFVVPDYDRIERSQQGLISALTELQAVNTTDQESVNAWGERILMRLVSADPFWKAKREQLIEVIRSVYPDFPAELLATSVPRLSLEEISTFFGSIIRAIAETDEVQAPPPPKPKTPLQEAKGFAPQPKQVEAAPVAIAAATPDPVPPAVNQTSFADLAQQLSVMTGKIVSEQSLESLIGQ